MPAQVVDQPRARGDQALAVIDEQPDIELDRSRAARPAASRAPRGSPPWRSRPRRSHPTCRAHARCSRAPAVSFGATRTTRSPAREQEPLERAGDVAAVLDRPDPLPVQTPRPGKQLIERPALRATPSDPPAPPGRRINGRARCARSLCVSVPITIICPVPSLGSPMNGSPVDTAQSGRCHAPIKSGRGSTGGGERHNAKQVRPRVDSKPGVSSPPTREPTGPVGRCRRPWADDDSEASLAPKGSPSYAQRTRGSESFP